MGEREAEIRGLARLAGPVKAARRDTDNREGDFVNLNRFAEDARVGVETIAPKPLRNDRDGSGGGTVVFRRQRASDQCGNTEPGIVAAGDELRGRGRLR